MARLEVEWTSRSMDQTVQLGRSLAEIVRSGDVIGLTGQLGAGKTQFVRGLAGGLGADERLVSSPTFVLMCQYPAALPLIHIDAYRMENLADLESIGWSDELLNGSVTAIEWADRIENQLPDDRLCIEMEHIDENQRRIVFTADDAWQQRWATLLDMLEKTS